MEEGKSRNRELLTMYEINIFCITTLNKRYILINITEEKYYINR